MSEVQFDDLVCPGRDREIFCNRTLNLRAIKAIGYDMDYTLIHYNADAWEERAYEYVKNKLADLDWPVEDLEYQPDLITRGLVIDTVCGNIVKANRFGYVKQASHGTSMLSFDDQRKLYSRTLVEFDDQRYVFLNTLFSLSEACMFAQLVDRVDAGRIKAPIGYPELYRTVHQALDESHAEGLLKRDILASPEDFIIRDPNTTRALLDQKLAGKKLLLITNSDWEYTRRVMEFEFDPELPGEMTWRDMFDLVIVSSRKPHFFDSSAPAYEVAREDEGLLIPSNGGIEAGKVYVGGNARLVEELWDLAGEEILFVGDHVYADVEVSKNLLRWRTALVLRELEGEVASLTSFRWDLDELRRLMQRKVDLEQTVNRLRLIIQRQRASKIPGRQFDFDKAQGRIENLRKRIFDLDNRIRPIVIEYNSLLNANWGLMLRAGNDKSMLARQVENFADIYMSRVSNFLYATPFAYLRSQRSTLPHDQEDATLSETNDSN